MKKNTMTVIDMITELKRYGITAEWKSIYDDIEALRHYGVDIATRKTKTTDYFVASRVFELPELKLLVVGIKVKLYTKVIRSCLRSVYLEVIGLNTYHRTNASI